MKSIFCRLIVNFNNKYQLYLKSGMGFHSNDARVVVAQKGQNILPYSIGGDLGTVLKPLPNLLVQPALWYLYLQQEFVYVGDEAVVEPSGKSQRYGMDLSVRYQPLKRLFCERFDVGLHLEKMGVEPANSKPFQCGMERGAILYRNPFEK